MISASTNFDPPADGFQFINFFEFPYLFQVNLPFPTARGVGELVYGLCGGMCSAALDYHKAGMKPPAERDVDNIPLRLFRFLWTRQMNTLSTQVLEKLFTWAILDTKTLAKKTALEEAPAVMQSIDAGMPCILVLIRSKGFLKITQNHQVLAVGYEHDADTKDLTIRLYDPNHPRQVPALTMNLARPASGIKLAQSTGEPLRGFFKIEYTQASPPV